jgi:hypothetical protein
MWGLKFISATQSDSLKYCYFCHIVSPRLDDTKLNEHKVTIVIQKFVFCHSQFVNLMFLRYSSLFVESNVDSEVFFFFKFEDIMILASCRRVTRTRL